MNTSYNLRVARNRALPAAGGWLPTRPRDTQSPLSRLPRWWWRGLRTEPRKPSKAPEIPSRTAEILTREDEIPRMEKTIRKPLGLTNRIHASSLGFHIWLKRIIQSYKVIQINLSCFFKVIQITLSCFFQLMKSFWANTSFRGRLLSNGKWLTRF